MERGQLLALCALLVVLGLFVNSRNALFLFLGVLTGVVTGLIPGLHLNSFIPLLFFPGASEFVIGVIVSHSFFDFIPATFLGVPEESTALHVLPSHRMLLKGFALEAFELTVIGGVFSSLLAILLLPFLSLLVIQKQVVLLLLLVCLFAIVFTSQKKLVTVFVMLACFVFSSYLDYLPVLLSGFFGGSSILFFFFSEPVIPQQKHCDFPSFLLKPVTVGAFAGLFAGLFPSISSGVTALLAKKIGLIKSDVEAMTALGGTNTVYAVFAVLAIFLVGRPRSAAGQFLSKFSFSLQGLVGLFLVALGLSSMLALIFSRRLVFVFNKLPLRSLNFFVFVLLCVFSVFFFGWFGLLLFFLSCATGLFCVFFGVSRSVCMTTLLFPTIFFYAA